VVHATGPVPLAGTPRHHQWLAKTLARRAAAYLGLGKDHKGMALRDLEAALEHDPENAKLAQDVEKLKN